MYKAQHTTQRVCQSTRRAWRSQSQTVYTEQRARGRVLERVNVSSRGSAARQTLLQRQETTLTTAMGPVMRSKQIKAGRRLAGADSEGCL